MNDELDYGGMSPGELERLADGGDARAQATLDAFSAEMARIRALWRDPAPRPTAPSRAEFVQARLAPVIEEIGREADERRAEQRAASAERETMATRRWRATFAVAVVGAVPVVLALVQAVWGS